MSLRNTRQSYAGLVAFCVSYVKPQQGFNRLISYFYSCISIGDMETDKLV